jgi:hypothetical protein
MSDECCPAIDPEQWNGKTFDWSEKQFVRDRVFCLFYMPVGFGKTMKRVMQKLDAAKASSPDSLCLADHTSKWNMDIYLAVDRDVPDAELCSMSGRFMSRIYEGPFSDTGKWCADFADHARSDGTEIEKLFMWYTTCPKCAKQRGKNYVVIFGKVKQGATTTP